MVSYKILTYDSPETLAFLVNQHLDTGWELHGGVAVSIYGSSVVYAQAIKRNFN